MYKIVNYLLKDKMKVGIIFTAVFIGAILIVGATYAVSNSGTEHTVTFKCASGADSCLEGDGLPRKCETDKNGYIDSACLSFICNKCNYWSTTAWNGISGSANQTDGIKSSKFANIPFSQDITYYCVAGSSNASGCSIPRACYTCNSNTSIMKWSQNGNKDDACPDGYSKDLSINQSECVSKACYECKDNSNIVKWSTNGDSDNNCQSGYNITTKSESECVSKACYECKDNSDIVKWSTNGNSDNKCPSGYNITTKSESECVSNSCYKCNNDSNIMKWDNNGDSDAKCPSGYTSINRPKNECAAIENPKTGNILLFIVWIVGLGAISYSIYCYSKLKIK